MTGSTAKKPHDWDPALATEAVRHLIDQPGTLLEALLELQSRFGYIDDRGISLLADLFNLSRAEVHGVCSFYHDFRREKPGKHTIKVCQAESCQAMGSEALTRAIKQHLGVEFHQTTEDNNFTLEPVYCLGNCACSPNIMVDGQVHARMDIDRFKQLTAGLTRESN